jgi:hypothetical protein
MALYKTYGCSFTEYQWPTWTYFLGKVATIKRHGVPGWGNEDIARSILHNADNQSIQVVMWSGFDRVSRDNNKKFQPIGEGKYTGNDYNTERLLSRTYETIFAVNRYCNDHKITLHNFTAFPLEMGEENKIHNIKHPLKKYMPEMRMSFSEFCIDNKPLHPHVKDQHPTISQHLKYYNNVIADVIGSDHVDEDVSQQEKEYSILDTKRSWKNYNGVIRFSK